jgi:uncharacterized RDD family membrane protein YckC
VDAPPPLPPPPPGPTPTGAVPAWIPAPPLRAHGYAGFWQRFGAFLIDGLVLAPLWVIPFITTWTDFFRDIEVSVNTNAPPDMTEFFTTFLWWGIAIAAVNYAYNAVMIAKWNATVGKFALGLRVRRDDGSPAGWREALLRPLLPVFAGWANTVPGAGLIGLLDYLWMLWDPQKQTIHDKIASTIVVVKESPGPLR